MPPKLSIDLAIRGADVDVARVLDELLAERALRTTPMTTAH